MSTQHAESLQQIAEILGAPFAPGREIVLRAKELRADLTRVTAERDGEFRRSDIELADAVQKESYLRASVAELEQWKESASSVMNKCNLQAVGNALGLRIGADVAPEILPGIKALQQRNAELEAALRPIYALRENCEGDIGWRGQKDAKVGWVTVRDILALESALTRAEAAAPAPHADTVRLDWVDAEHRTVMSFFDGSFSCWTVAGREFSGNAARAAIDAAMKGGAK